MNAASVAGHVITAASGHQRLYTSGQRSGQIGGDCQ